MNFCHHWCMEFVPNYFLLIFRYDTLLISVPVALFISVEIKMNTLQSPKALHCTSSFVVYIFLKLYGFPVQE